MYLLYLDDSGSANNADEEYLVIGGICVFEAQVDWFTQQLNRIAESIDPNMPHQIEFHASEIFSRKQSVWRNMTQDEARGVIKAVLKVIDNAYESASVFACAVHKASYPNQDPVELAFEDLISRFDCFLDSTKASGERQRGLVILDKSAYEKTLQKLAREFRVGGTRWRSIKNLVETAFFIDSRLSRLIQLADHIAYSTFRRFNTGDTQYFDIFASRFFQADGIVHGLAHKQTVNQFCMCPGCLSRRQKQSSTLFS